MLFNFVGTCLNVTSVRVYQERQRFSQTSHVYNIAEGAVAADAKRGGKTTGKREITLNFLFTSNTGGSSVPRAILGLKGH